MRSQLSEGAVEQTIEFHGHLCPGLTLGMRVAEVALREIGSHAADEEVVADVETDSCAVDAIQYLVGCTFGKGNLVHLDYGRSVFTFVRRSDGKAVRVTARPQDKRQLTPEVEELIQRVQSGDGSEADERSVSELLRQRALAVLEVEETDLLEVVLDP